MRVTKHELAPSFAFEHGLKTCSRSSFTLDWSRCECHQELLSIRSYDLDCPLRHFPGAPQAQYGPMRKGSFHDILTPMTLTAALAVRIHLGGASSLYFFNILIPSLIMAWKLASFPGVGYKL